MAPSGHTSLPIFGAGGAGGVSALSFCAGNPVRGERPGLAACPGVGEGVGWGGGCGSCLPSFTPRRGRWSLLGVGEGRGQEDWNAHLDHRPKETRKSGKLLQSVHSSGCERQEPGWLVIH